MSIEREHEVVSLTDLAKTLELDATLFIEAVEVGSAHPLWFELLSTPKMLALQFWVACHDAIESAQQFSWALDVAQGEQRRRWVELLGGDIRPIQVDVDIEF